MAAVEAVETSGPVTVAYGTVVSTEPLAVQLDQKILLTKEFLVNLNHQLLAGDSLVLLRVQGGQEYLILGKRVAG